MAQTPAQFAWATVPFIVLWWHDKYVLIISERIRPLNPTWLALVLLNLKNDDEIHRLYWCSLRQVYQWGVSHNHHSSWAKPLLGFDNGKSSGRETQLTPCWHLLFSMSILVSNPMLLLGLKGSCVISDSLSPNYTNTVCYMSIAKSIAHHMIEKIWKLNSDVSDSG